MRLKRDDARAWCLAHNADLVSVLSREENDFLMTLKDPYVTYAPKLHFQRICRYSLLTLSIKQLRNGNCEICFSQWSVHDRETVKIVPHLIQFLNYFHNTMNFYLY